MKTTNKHVFFWNGIYSQWYPSPVTIDGIDFNCMEQFMMYSKAIHFNDEYHAKLIMDTINPKEQKGYGRRVTNFDALEWDAVSFDIVKKGNYAKFTQIQEFKDALLNTGNRTLVEASPYDKIWGIGMMVGDKGINEEKNWRGKNLLGKAITEVRELIKSENGK